MNFDNAFKTNISSMAKWAQESGVITAEIPMATFIWN